MTKITSAYLKSYINIPQWMFTIMGLKGTDAMVFAIIYGYCKNKDAYVGGYAYIASKIGKSLNAIIRSVHKLQTLGYISIEHSIGEVNTIKCNGLDVLKEVEICIENLDDLGQKKLEKIIKKLRDKIQKNILQGDLNVL